MKRELLFERFYPHPLELVWFALTDRDALAQWLMENDFAPEVGHRFQLRTEPAPGFDGIVNCEVLEVREHERLSYTWRGGPIDTVITFTLEREGAGTRLRVQHTGFAGLKSVIVSFILQSGIRMIYDRKLPRLLDRLAAGVDTLQGDDERSAGYDIDPVLRARMNILARLSAAVPSKTGRHADRSASPDASSRRDEDATEPVNKK